MKHDRKKIDINWWEPSISRCDETTLRIKLLVWVISATNSNGSTRFEIAICERRRWFIILVKNDNISSDCDSSATEKEALAIHAAMLCVFAVGTAYGWLHWWLCCRMLTYIHVAKIQFFFARYFMATSLISIRAFLDAPRRAMHLLNLHMIAYCQRLSSLCATFFVRFFLYPNCCAA